MKLPENVTPMPPDQRAELGFLAKHALEEFSGKGWVFEFSRAGVVSTRSNQTILMANPNIGPTGATVLLSYVAALPPEVALATLAYVEALEAEVERLVSTTVSNEVYTNRTDTMMAQIEALTAYKARREAKDAEDRSYHG